MHIRTLSNNECTTLLGSNRVGILACSREGQPYIVPIHYAFESISIYAFSMPGKKVDWMRANPLVSMLVEERGQGKRWKSVIAEGRFEEFSDRTGQSASMNHAWTLLSKDFDWWEPGALKPIELPRSDHSPHIFFRILVDRVSGREPPVDVQSRGDMALVLSFISARGAEEGSLAALTFASVGLSWR